MGERWNRGVDCPGAMLYRVRTFDGAQWMRNKRDVRAHCARAAERGDRAIVHRVILTARMTPKTLALALLNGDESAFAKIEDVDPTTWDIRNA